MVWGCFAASGHGQLAINAGKMNSQVYQDILQENVRQYVCQLKLNRSQVMQLDNDPKTEVNQQQNGLNRRKYTFWSGPVSPDLKLIERLWHDLTRAVHTRHPKNIAELKQFCKEEWSKIPPDRCAGPIRNYRNCFVQIIAAKRGSTSY